MSGNREAFKASQFHIVRRHKWAALRLTRCSIAGTQWVALAFLLLAHSPSLVKSPKRWASKDYWFMMLNNSVGKVSASFFYTSVGRRWKLKRFLFASITNLQRSISRALENAKFKARLSLTVSFYSRQTSKVFKDKLFKQEASRKRSYFSSEISNNSRAMIKLVDYWWAY